MGSLFLSILFFIGFHSNTLASVTPAVTPFSEFLMELDKPPRNRKRMIPSEMNPSIQYWIDQFKGPQHAIFEGFLNRGSYYKTQIEGILARNGAPVELYYLAMIESGFVTHAKSSANAVGIWQFIKPTAKKYGLRQDRMIDERRDVIRSTYAASRYILDLYNEFGSWYLAMAAYNAGEARVEWAIHEGKSRDYWKLAHEGLFPRETLDYIPKFQAAMQIAQDPARFGFASKPLLKYPPLRKFKVIQTSTLTGIARKLQLSGEALRAFNPHIIHDVIPSYLGGYEVWIPDLYGLSPKILSKLKAELISDK